MPEPAPTQEEYDNMSENERNRRYGAGSRKNINPERNPLTRGYIFRPVRNMRPFETARVSALDDAAGVGFSAVSDIEPDVLSTGLGDFSVPRRGFPAPEPTFGQEDE